jgi:hypothetical protein
VSSIRRSSNDRRARRIPSPVLILLVIGLLVVLAVIVFIFISQPVPPKTFAADESRLEFVVSVAPGSGSANEQAIAAVQEVIGRRLSGIGRWKWNVLRAPAGSPGHLVVQVGAGPSELARIRTLIASRAAFELRLEDGTVVVNGSDIATARPSTDGAGRPAVSFSLKKDGAARLHAATEKNIGKHLAIVIDGHVEATPRIEDPVGADGQITGPFTEAEAHDLALLLRVGELPSPVNIVAEHGLHQRP